MLRRDSAREREAPEYTPRALHDKHDKQDARPRARTPDGAVMARRQMALERGAAADVAPTPLPPAQPPRAASPARAEPRAEPVTRVLTLEHGEHHDSTIYRFDKGTTVRFAAGPSLLGRKVFLYTNYIITDSQDENAEVSEFVRNQYYLLEWRREGEAGAEALGAGALVTDTDLFAELRLTRAGAFHYYFVYDSAESAVGPRGSGWLQAAPTLRVGGAALRVEALAVQTVLAKCLGPLARWEHVLRPAKESGYNMIHFTPIQELGASNSSYSIADQLRLNPAFGADASLADVEALLGRLRAEWGVAAMCDVVLNHTANETPWLAEHPEATYNCANVPRLRPAALLDAALARASRAAARGDLLPRGVPAVVNTHEHLEAVRHYLETTALPELRLHELFTCDVPALLQQFYALARNKVPSVSAVSAPELALLPDPLHRRLHATVDMERALQLYNVYLADCYDEESRLKACCEALRRRLEQLNAAAHDLLAGHLRAAVDNCVAGMRYHRLQADGPKIEEVSAKHPLVPRYFTGAGECGSAGEAEALVFGEGGRVMAHNGWVMDADPLLDFAAASDVYLRRELIAWGDSVKLRYGDKPEDSPWLWAHMREYVELTAELFDGLRLDNCHSTPLHVAEYMMDCARNVKPDLFVAAELFTNSDLVDNIFVNRLGISALIREAQAAWDAREQGRLLHRFGGRPAGAFRRARVDVARAELAPALLLDLTHDNPSPIEKRSVHDVLPTAALVSMAYCACGSTRGLDELVPHHVHVVDETRQYAEWGAGAGQVGGDCGLLAARRELNLLHQQLAQQGYDEVYVDQMTEEVTAVTRHAPRSRRSVLLVARTAFRAPAGPDAAPLPPPLRFEGDLEEILFEMELEPKSGAPYARDARVINGLPQWAAAVRRPAPGAARLVLAPRRDGAHTELAWRALPPGAVLAIRIGPRPEQRAALDVLERTLEACDAGAPDALGLDRALEPLELADFTALLYRCEAEERDAAGGGVYDVPGHGPLVYAGLQGIMSLLEEVRAGEQLGHAVCDNLRAGDWLPEYTWRRLRAPRLAPAAARLRDLLAPLADLPRYLVPTYAEALLRAAHAAVSRAALARMPPACRAGELARALALCSVQLVGCVPSAALPAASPALPPPRPAPAPASVTLSAGLPHFAVGYMRCWGRDTFIALRGAMLLTGRYQDARAHILGFAACLRHGLIPNLLDGGANARYNCRDAVWWWLHAIKQYVTEAPQGSAILSEPVSRLFPADDAAPAPPGAVDQPLADVMQEALEVHFQGLVFRERNAGRQIDAHMTDKGFNVQIGVDPETGFPFGGNDANCGTWMDKMGSSEAAGTRGRPATPRDGSAVELVALAHSAVAWLAGLHRAGRFPHAGVARRHADGTLTSWSYAQWAERIRRSFERYFWVPAAPSALDLRPDLVHRRAIYKDSHGASQPWADYQLRCNAVVAMAVAPELFDPEHAWLALDNTERLLLGPLGLKTLDPADWAYRPEYDNSNNSDDPSVAHGFNYHQGPEWTWPLGFYLRARLAFAHDAGRWAKTLAGVHAALGAPAAELRASPWRGLPELTGPGGAPCRDACRTQAWSSACLLELLHELRAARRARPLPAD